MDKNLRVKANVGKDKILHLNLKQNVDLFEILSLSLTQEDAYKLHTSNYGVVVGRILANDAFGVPNAKVSVFVPITDEDKLNTQLVSIYPYKSTTDLNDEGKRYNLLPDYKVDDCYTNVGTFPSKRMVLDNDTVLEIYDKYYKYTATTNKAGDYMIFGVPTGNTQIHVDVDLSDIGILSQKPRDFVSKGYNINQFQSPTRFKDGSNLDNLAQIYSQDEALTVYPFWGDENAGEAAITRKDVNLQYTFETSCVFLGCAITDSKNNDITHTCDVESDAGLAEQLVTGEGNIEMIRKTPYGNVEEYPIKGNQLIDSDGTWCYQIPMNLDYVGMDEYGNIVPTNDPTKGIPTRARVRFRISLNESGNNTLTRHKARYLVPNNPFIEPDKKHLPKMTEETKANINNFYTFGTKTPDICFRDLLWNNVYTVKSFIPRIQKGQNAKTEYYSGIKGINKRGAANKNPFPYNKLKLKMSMTSFTNISYFTNNVIINEDEDRDLFWETVANKNYEFTTDTVLASLIEETDGLSLDFYNDWVNGVLYFPLWFWRVRKKSKYSSGEMVYDSQYCKDTKNFDNLYNFSTCDLPYGVDENGNNKLSIKLSNFDYDNAEKKYFFFGNNGFDRRGTAKKIERGIIRSELNKDGANVYYYSHSQNRYGSDGEEFVRLYSTDLVLLGSLIDNDINGIPQFNDSFPTTSANVPPIGTYTITGDNEENLQETITGMHWGTDKEERDSKYGMKFRTGLFFGTSFFGSRHFWFTNMAFATTYSLPKTCINVERICELGVSLDMSTKKDSTDVTTVNEKDNFGVNDGLITKREIEDEESRQLFSTLNSKPLIVSSENTNPITGYYNYPIFYTCPTDFNGTMSPFVSDFTNGYSYDDESLDYESFRFGGYKKYVFNTIEKYDENEPSNNVYFYPSYNNSYYFYFGLNAGDTAIEKFKKNYFDKCDVEEAIEVKEYAEIISRPDYVNRCGGSIAFDFDDENIDCYAYQLIEAKNIANIDKGMCEIDTSDIGSRERKSTIENLIEDEIVVARNDLAGLPFGDYTFSVSGFASCNYVQGFFLPNIGSLSSVKTINVSFNEIKMFATVYSIDASSEQATDGEIVISDINLYGNTFKITENNNISDGLLIFTDSNDNNYTVSYALSNGFYSQVEIIDDELHLKGVAPNADGYELVLIQLKDESGSETTSNQYITNILVDYKIEDDEQH